MARREGRSAPTAVYVESGARRVFACCLDWPGWCRSGRDEELALEALAAAAPRYAAVAAEAGIAFRAGTGNAFDVVERLQGGAGTDFGVPSSLAASDAEPLTREEAERLVALVAASWTVLDRVVAGAPPELRKGPRGGGRDRDAIVQHVIGAEVAYGRKLGIRLNEPERGDAAAVAAQRGALLDALRALARGTPADLRHWPARYAARRLAWHVLDHAWEIEDRSEPASG